MKSLIGPKGPHTAKGTPYVTYAFGVEDGDPKDVFNALMQTLAIGIAKNPDKNIVWRELPNIQIEKNIHKARARWAFE